jgi:hypothetical protein
MGRTLQSSAGSVVQRIALTQCSKAINQPLRHMRQSRSSGLRAITAAIAMRAFRSRSAAEMLEDDNAHAARSPCTGMTKSATLARRH